MKIKVQYQWTDLLQAELLHMQPSGWRKIVAYGAYSFIALALISILALFFIGQPGVDLGYVLLLSILLLGSPFLYRHVLLPNRVKRNFPKQKELILPFEFEFTETGLNTSNELGNSTRPWTYFTTWKENEEVMILYLTNASIVIIPKRSFADPQQIETVKSYLEKNAVPKIKGRFR